VFHLGLLARITYQIRLSILVALECVLPAARPYWKGYLKLSFVSYPVALYPATSAAERISFRQVNRRTGHRLKHKIVDSVTGEAVETSDKTHGFEIGGNEFLLVEDRDLAQARSERQTRLHPYCRNSAARNLRYFLHGGRHQPPRENHWRPRQAAVWGPCSHAAPRLRLCLGQCGS
jgi:hypothetical protein